MKKFLIIAIIIAVVVLTGCVSPSPATNGDSSTTSDKDFVWLEWRSQPDVQNPWEKWENAPQWIKAPGEEELLQQYLHDELGVAVQEFKRVETQSQAEWDKLFAEKQLTNLMVGERGLVIRIKVAATDADKLIAAGWQRVEND